MIVITSAKQMQQFATSNKTIGLVPTMGYLHEGHLSLVRKAKSQNDVVVVSIFVNPTQFGVGEDLEKYPRDFDRDYKMLEELNVDVLFYPDVKTMYPDGYATYVDVTDITQTLCGLSRPNHFRGVCTVVLKLFNITKANKAYFGQKDAQQYLVIKKMANDLNLDIDIISCPIVRDENGLALSSRNVYLSDQEKEQAYSLSQSLNMASEMIKNGHTDAIKIKEMITKHIMSMPLANIEYVEIKNTNDLGDVTTIDGEILIALAVRFGKTRLIDNIILEVKNAN